MSYEEEVQDNLKRAQALHLQRNAVYKDNWRKAGAVLAALFPEGITLKSEEDFARWHLLELMIVKLTRYTADPQKPHPDSLVDLIVYSAMVATIDQENEDAPKLPWDEAEQNPRFMINNVFHPAADAS